MEAVVKSKLSPTEDTVGPRAESVSHLDCLAIPQSNDSINVLQRKLTALADAVCRGQSIAVMTNYAASTIQQRDPVKIAVSEMPPQELDFWSLYAEGKYPLPKVDWDDNRGSLPTSARPLRTARRRAEALNRLYKTDNADPSHAVWFTKNEDFHLPLVKAMARVIGAERNLLGGQGALDATQIADLQSINEILSVSAQISHGPGRNAISQAIASAQRILGSHRDMLRNILGGSARKRKRDSE
ncbi:hypothetical protein DL764_004741 [Monosporascus ibericus]|uniref:Uncharacterized protein n=1 Tax=Monosporascus ibericus TaxID=155417 RepID=A0A4V1XAU9_9PEZI|nr:hypothetical protein DL764_004741 [Monosporascus ibericus]